GCRPQRAGELDPGQVARPVARRRAVAHVELPPTRPARRSAVGKQPTALRHRQRGERDGPVGDSTFASSSTSASATSDACLYSTDWFCKPSFLKKKNRPALWNGAPYLG